MLTSTSNVMWKKESQHINANLKVIKAVLDSFVLTFAKIVCTRRVRIRARQQNLSLIFFSFFVFSFFFLYSADLLHLSAVSIILNIMIYPWLLTLLFVHMILSTKRTSMYSANLLTSYRPYYAVLWGGNQSANKSMSHCKL